MTKDEFLELDRAGKLEELTNIALGHVYTMLVADTSKLKPRAAATIEMRRERVIDSVLKLQARVDESKLKERTRDKLGELLDLIQRQQGKIPPPQMQLIEETAKRIEQEPEVSPWDATL